MFSKADLAAIVIVAASAVSIAAAPVRQWGAADPPLKHVEGLPAGRPRAQSLRKFREEATVIKHAQGHPEHPGLVGSHAKVRSSFHVTEGHHPDTKHMTVDYKDPTTGDHRTTIHIDRHGHQLIGDERSREAVPGVVPPHNSAHTTPQSSSAGSSPHHSPSSSPGSSRSSSPQPGHRRELREDIMAELISRRWFDEELD